RFVGESGAFEVGTLAVAEKAKLPPDALDIVQQLLVWLPDDLRLYWLLGELYNARGGTANIEAAQLIFTDLEGATPLVADKGWNRLGLRAKEFLEQKKALAAWQPPPLEDFAKKIDAAEQKDKTQPARFEWQTLAIAFATGVVVGIFGMWQLKE